MQKSQSLKATPSQPPSVAEVRFTQKTRSTFNSQRFEDLPSEVVFAEVLLLEIQQAVGILYGALVRFYLPVISLNDLEELREDLIETVTSNLVSGALADACLKLCRLSTREEEIQLTEKYATFGNLHPEQLGLPSFFTLNKTSHLARVIDDEWARHHYDENQKKFRESEIFSGDCNEEYVSQEEDVIDFIDSQSTFCPSLPSEELQSRLGKEPFADAIVYLQENLKTHKNPIDKQRCLTHTTVLISQGITEHFNGVEFANKKSKLTLDADTLINLCVYVLLKARCVEIYAHLKLANQFATN